MLFGYNEVGQNIFLAFFIIRPIIYHPVIICIKAIFFIKVPACSVKKVVGLLG
jgi:hypothetical protein